MKTLLMIAHYFPPCLAAPTSAARTRGLASWLGESGWRAVVVAPELRSVCLTELPAVCERCQEGEELNEGGYEIVRVPVHLRLNQVLPEVRHPFVRKTQTLGHLVRASVGNLETLSDWPARAAEACQREIARSSISLVWATYTPLSSLWVADTVARRTDLPWVADLRDAASLRWKLANYRNIAALSRGRRMLRRADAVVDVTPQHAALDARWLGRRCETITSGFDPNDWRGITASRNGSAHLEVVFAGNLYPGYRTLGPAMAGLRWLRDCDPSTPVRLTYYGRSEELVGRDATRYGVEDLIEYRGFVPPEEVRHRLAAADVLLLPTNEAGDSGVPGGKFYEYLAAKRPILAVPGDDQFVAAVLNEAGAGVAATTPEEVGGALQQWIEEWRRAGKPAAVGNEAVIERYSIRESARRLAGLLDEVVEQRARSRTPA